MKDENLYEKLFNAVVQGMNRTGVLFNEWRLKPDGLDFTYQLHHLEFQLKRGNEPGFYLHVMQECNKSRIVENRLNILTKAILLDFVEGNFRSDVFFSEPEGYYERKSRKKGTYNPRQIRRIFNQSYRTVIFDSDNSINDERIALKNTVFNPFLSEIPNVSQEAIALMREETQENMKNYSNDELYHSIAFLQCIFPEYWGYYSRFENVYKSCLGEIENRNDVYEELNRWVRERDRALRILFNHLSSILAIEWFMKKDPVKREDLLGMNYKWRLDEDEIRQGLKLLIENFHEEGSLLVIVPSISKSLMYYGKKDNALFLLEEAAPVFNESHKIVYKIELGALQRETGHYAEMLDTLNSAYSDLDEHSSDLERGLVMTRLAEAYYFNGETNKFREMLKRVFTLALSSNEKHLTGTDELSFYRNVAYQSDNEVNYIDETPVKISLFSNIITACERTGECGLKIHFLQRSIENIGEYYDTEYGKNYYIILNKMLTREVLTCKKFEQG